VAAAVGAPSQGESASRSVEKTWGRFSGKRWEKLVRNQWLNKLWFMVDITIYS